METEKDEFNLDLDISWMNEIKNNEEEQEREPMSDIKVSFMYISESQEIHKVITEKYDIEVDEDGETFLSKDFILSKISKKLTIGTTHYKLIDALLFVVDIEPDEISTLSTRDFITKITFLDDIIIPMSLPIFHSNNSIYFLLREIPVQKKTSLHISADKETLEPDQVISTSKTRKTRTLAKYTRKRKVTM
jgi:hypothetical protein